jgi:hypothetical protein
MFTEDHTFWRDVIAAAIEDSSKEAFAEGFKYGFEYERLQYDNSDITIRYKNLMQHHNVPFESRKKVSD